MFSQRKKRPARREDEEGGMSAGGGLAPARNPVRGIAAASGDSLSLLLQVVTVSGKPGDIIEKRYDSPMFSRVKVKEVDEIGVELKTLTNRHVPFVMV